MRIVLTPEPRPHKHYVVFHDDLTLMAAYWTSGTVFMIGSAALMSFGLWPIPIGGGIVLYGFALRQWRLITAKSKIFD